MKSMDILFFLGFLICQVVLFSMWAQQAVYSNSDGSCNDNVGNDRTKSEKQKSSNFKSKLKEIISATPNSFPSEVSPKSFSKWAKHNPGGETKHRPVPCSPFISLKKEKWWTHDYIRTPTQTGLLFVKEMKTGSSTMSGIVLRIARNEAMRRIRRYKNKNTAPTTIRAATPSEIKRHYQQKKSKSSKPHLQLTNRRLLQEQFRAKRRALQDPTTTHEPHNYNHHDQKEVTHMCNVRFDHSSALLMNYAQRKPLKSFLMTMIRHPTSRLISQFFHFHVSRFKEEPTDENFRNFVLERRYLQDYYIRDLVVHDMGRPKNFYRNFEIKKYLQKGTLKSLNNMRKATIHQILHEYNWIGITERFDESIVVLKMLLDLPMSDIVYLSAAKGQGLFDDGAYEKRCTYIVPSFLSPGMQRFFQSEEYFQYVRGDLWLYHAAQQALNMTIEHTLGRSNFEFQLQQFRLAQNFARQRCPPGNMTLICSASGKRKKFKNQNVGNITDCLWLDSGCGAPCLDSISHEIDNLVSKSSTTTTQQEQQESHDDGQRQRRTFANQEIH